MRPQGAIEQNAARILECSFTGGLCSIAASDTKKCIQVVRKEGWGFACLFATHMHEALIEVESHVPGQIPELHS